MKDYQIRVIEEKKELDKKLSKLDAFLTNDTPLEKPEYDRLKRQHRIMLLYSQVLQERIENF